MIPEDLAKKLRNIGPKTATQLLAIGVESKEQLTELGAEEVYIMMMEQGVTCGKPHAAYLYALDGAIHDIDWRKVPEARKQAYKALTKSLKQEYLA